MKEVEHTDEVIGKLRFIVTTTYNHNPEAVERAVDFLARCAARRVAQYGIPEWLLAKKRKERVQEDER